MTAHSVTSRGESAVDVVPGVVPDGAPAGCGATRTYRGIAVDKRITDAYAETVWAAAIDSLIQTCGPELSGVMARAAMILFLCKRMKRDAPAVEPAASAEVQHDA